MSEPAMDPSSIWNKAVDLVKDRITHMSLWKTLEQTVGLTIENETLVVGLPSRVINQAGYLEAADHRNVINRCVAQVAGRPLRVRVIEGDCIGDWENLKKREERVRLMREATYDRTDRRAEQAQSWDEVAEGASRAWSACNLRALPQTKARYVRDMVGILQDAVQRLCPGGPSEADERMIAKVIDRIATNSELPPTLVALELERLAG